MQQLVADAVVAQHIRNFLWGLAELQEHLGIRLPDQLPGLLAAAVEWAGSRWAQLSALDVVDLCYNLARLGHQPCSAWIRSAISRSVAPHFCLAPLCCCNIRHGTRLLHIRK